MRSLVLALVLVAFSGAAASAQNVVLWDDFEPGTFYRLFINDEPYSSYLNPGSYPEGFDLDDWHGSPADGDEYEFREWDPFGSGDYGATVASGSFSGSGWSNTLGLLDGDPPSGGGGEEEEGGGWPGEVAAFITPEQMLGLLEELMAYIMPVFVAFAIGLSAAYFVWRMLHSFVGA